MERLSFGNRLFQVIYGFSKMERIFCRNAGIYYGQPRILTVLRDHQGLSLTELSPICGIGLPSLSVSLRNLQKSGLVVKSGTGKRQKIYLTEEGINKAMCFHGEMEDFYTYILQEMGEETAQRFFDDLGTFSSLMDAYEKRTFGEEIQNAQED